VEQETWILKDGEVREMRTAETVLSIVRERGKRGLPLTNVYRQLYNEELFLRAYGRIYRNDGAMTRGITKETVDGMSQEKVASIIEALRFERYRWTPVRRVEIPKKNGKTRPLGIPTWSDKLLQEVMRMILEAYYEPQFSDYSHGFRPGRGCHTALESIHRGWKGTKWFIEGDIKGCFDSIDHEVLLKILRDKILDNRFLRLVEGLLRAGYCEEWRYRPTLSGTPQGGIISPLLANIFLDKLDKFVETTLLANYTRGISRRPNKEYFLLLHRRKRRRASGKWDEAKAMLKQMQSMNAFDPHDPDYRRLRYCRYADDFLLGFAGTKGEAEQIKSQLAMFLREELHLELSPEKTLITHARTGSALFLGYEVNAMWNHLRIHNGWRGLHGHIGLRIPNTFIDGKCRRFMKAEKVMARPELQRDSDFDIITRYQQEYRGYVEYYAMAGNLSWLNRLHWVMRDSLLKTLASKYRSTKRRMALKYRATAVTPGGPRKCIQVVIPREGKPPLVARFGGISLRRRARPILNQSADIGRHNWIGRVEIIQRLLADLCEICGSSQNVEVHHVRKLADLQTKGRKEKPLHVRIMAARRRKTLVLCRHCHDDLHAGRPLTRKPITE
jgi:group II intron reverse transcriptase/maturase